MARDPDFGFRFLGRHEVDVILVADGPPTLSESRWGKPLSETKYAEWKRAQARLSADEEKAA